MPKILDTVRRMTDEHLPKELLKAGEQEVTAWISKCREGVRKIGEIIIQAEHQTMLHKRTIPKALAESNFNKLKGDAESHIIQNAYERAYSSLEKGDRISGMAIINALIVFQLMLNDISKIYGPNSSAMSIVDRAMAGLDIDV